MKYEKRRREEEGKRGELKFLSAASFFFSLLHIKYISSVVYTIHNNISTQRVSAALLSLCAICSMIERMKRSIEWNTREKNQSAIYIVLATLESSAKCLKMLKYLISNAILKIYGSPRTAVLIINITEKLKMFVGTDCNC